MITAISRLYLDLILSLYLNIVTEVIRGDIGRLLLAPVWANCDSRPGCLAVSYSNINYRTKMKDIWLNLGLDLGYPNGTSRSDNGWSVPNIQGYKSYFYKI